MTPENSAGFESLNVESLLLKRLASHPLSAAEVDDFLEGYDLDRAEHERIRERIGEFGYVNDKRLAEQIFHVVRVRKGMSLGAAEKELNRRQIPSTIIDELLSDDSDDDHARAVQLVEDRLRKQTVRDKNAERRLISFLMRKGYSMGIARTAVRECLFVK